MTTIPLTERQEAALRDLHSALLARQPAGGKGTVTWTDGRAVIKLEGVDEPIVIEAE